MGIVNPLARWLTVVIVLCALVVAYGGAYTEATYMVVLAIYILLDSKEEKFHITLLVADGYLAELGVNGNVTPIERVTHEEA